MVVRRGVEGARFSIAFFVDMFTIGVLAAALCGFAAAQAGTYQAESATLDGVTVGTSVAGFSGTIRKMVGTSTICS